MEDAGRKLKLRDNIVQRDLRPFEIKTIKLRIWSSVHRHSRFGAPK